MGLEKIEHNPTRQTIDVFPVDPKKVSSSWQTIDKSYSAALNKIKGNPYKAYICASTENPMGSSGFRFKMPVKMVS